MLKVKTLKTLKLSAADLLLTKITNICWTNMKTDPTEKNMDLQHYIVTCKLCFVVKYCFGGYVTTCAAPLRKTPGILTRQVNRNTIKHRIYSLI